MIHFDRLRYNIDRMKITCEPEVVEYIETISESSGALLAHATILSSLGASPFSEASLTILRSRIMRRGRISTFDLSTLNLIIRIRKHFSRDFSDCLLLRKKWSKYAGKKDRQRLKSNARNYRADIINWLRVPKKTKVEKRDAALFAILIFVPLRLRTIANLEKSQYQNSVLFIPSDLMKTRKPINPRLPPLAAKVLNDYMSSRSDDFAPLFIGAKGGPVAQESIQRAIRRRTKKLLGEELGSHDFRRIIATAYANSPDTAAALLTVSRSILIKHYDLSDSSDKLNIALASIGE
jgi:integrase